MKNKAKVLLLDIETAPILARVWDIWDQTVGLNQIKNDSFVLSWSAKWLDSKEVMYMDQRDSKNIEDDSKILKHIWKLIDEADVVIGQNSKRFDIKRLNARFIQHGFKPPSSFCHLDTLQITKKHFAFTSHKLEYMTEKLCTKYKKSQHRKFPGFSLWKECLAGNLEAFKEMESYNKMDVLSLEELYHKIAPWDQSINFNVYHDNLENTCKCGSTKFKKNGFRYTNNGKYQRFECKNCGHETASKVNLLDKAKRMSLRK